MSARKSHTQNAEAVHLNGKSIVANVTGECLPVQMPGFSPAAQSAEGQVLADPAPFLLTVEQAAEFCGMSQSWVRDRCNLGDWKGARREGGKWLVSRAWLEAHYGANATQASVPVVAPDQIETYRRFLRALSVGIQAALAELEDDTDDLPEFVRALRQRRHI